MIVVNSNVDVQKRLVEILKAVSLESYIVFNISDFSMDHYERMLRALEFATIASHVAQFATDPIRRREQEKVDRHLTQPLFGENYENSIKMLKRYIKETIFNKTYLDRKFCKCLTYEEQEQEILRGKSLERELAEIIQMMT